MRTGSPTPASDTWWATGWAWGEEEAVNFVELLPREHLGWKERYVLTTLPLYSQTYAFAAFSFVSIATGKDHMLALTSKGRAFSHPINKKANAYGQLGFRRFDIPVHSHKIDRASHHMEVELIPKSLADPFINSTRSTRSGTAAPTMSENLINVDDSTVKFCPYLFEIPALKGVDVSQVAAGGRSSFVRTSSGRVLGWGANEYGYALPCHPHPSCNLTRLLPGK